MSKGIVMEVGSKSIIVMTAEGAFERIPAKNRSCQVGEEIVYSPHQARFRQPTFAAVSILVAAVMFCMVLFSGLPSLFADKSVVAYVSIDINPSVEIGIDSRERVREARGLNDQGTTLIQGLKADGRPLEEVAERLIKKAEELKYFQSGEADVVITSTVVKAEADLNEEKLAERLKQQVLTHVVMTHPEKVETIQVTAFTAPEEVRVEAKQNGLSAGKYSVYLNAKGSGHEIQVEDLKKDSVHVIAKEEGGIAKLLDEKKLNKEAIKELLKEEKNGELDKKLKDKKAKEEDKKSPKPTTKPAASTPKPTPAATVKPSASPAQQPGKASPKNTPKPSASGKDDKKDDEKDNKKDEDKNKNNGNNGNNGNGKKEDDDKKNERAESPKPQVEEKEKPAATPKKDSKDEDRRTSGPSANEKEKIENNKEKKNEKDQKNDKKTD